MTTMTLQIENPSIIPSLRKVLRSIDGVTIAKSTPRSRSKTVLAKIPNKTTLDAMREVESGNDAGEVSLESLDSFVASMM